MLLNRSLASKKRSGAVQVVVEEGQRQQEMNFADQGEMQLEERDGGDRDRLDLAVDDLRGHCQTKRA